MKEKTMNEQLQRAVQFFKSERAYQQLFQAFKNKYESLGRIGGNVTVEDFSDVELEEIGKFFGLPGGDLRAKGFISLRQFEHQLANTRFGSVRLKQLLEAYFEQELISKKEQLERKKAALQHFLRKIDQMYPLLTFWIDYLLDKKNEVRWILKIAENNPSSFKTYTQTLQKALRSLPKHPERLPVFSQRITGNPHAFDLHTDLGRIWIQLLSVYRHKKDPTQTEEVPSDTEGVNTLLQQFNIYRDDLLNFVTCANLHAETVDGIHPVFEAAANQHFVQLISLRELLLIKNVYPTMGNRIWIVENSGICATLLDYHPTVPIVCTNGQFTLATMTLLDLLAQNDCEFSYAGDFDPEGLGMAQRLLKRYPEQVQLWWMDNHAYKKANPTQSLTKERLEKLRSITEKPLLEVANVMRKVGKAAYQEALVDQMITDLDNYVQLFKGHTE